MTLDISVEKSIFLKNMISNDSKLSINKISDRITSGMYNGTKSSFSKIFYVTNYTMYKFSIFFYISSIDYGTRLNDI